MAPTTWYIADANVSNEMWQAGETASPAPAAWPEEEALSYDWTTASSPDSYFGTTATTQQQRHIIQTAWVELETEYFDDVITSLRQLAPLSEGYVESEQLSGHRWRVFTITLRIPSPNFYTVLTHVEGLATTRNSSQQSEDVTDQFYDTNARLETRRIEENRLLALIQEAENVHDLLELERRLSNTRLHIETYATRLTNLAGRVAYSTIFVTVTDIVEEEIIVAAGPTMGERIGGAFGESVDSIVSGFQSFVVFIAGAIIPIMFWGVAIFAIFILAKKFVRRYLSVR